MEVALDVLRIDPPVRVSPFEERRPAEINPPLNVDEAVDEAILMMPENVEEALSESIAKMGAVTLVPVAIVNAYLVLIGIVVVALLWYETVRLAALDDEIVMRFESRYVLPPTERWEEGVEVAIPRKLFVASTLRKLAEESAVDPV